MKIWVLFIIAFLLLILGLREKFVNAQGVEGEKLDNICPSGTTKNEQQTRCLKDGEVHSYPTCPEGYSSASENNIGFCFKPTATTTTTISSTAPDMNAIREEGRRLAANSEVNLTTTDEAIGYSAGTGGSSTTNYGVPPSSKNSKSVWGPKYTGSGEGEGKQLGGDSTKTTKYPTLLGGLLGEQTKEIPGAGFVPETNKSMMPGDLDLIPNPYKIGNAFSAPSKTDPVPFLTDFSAFLK